MIFVKLTDKQRRKLFSSIKNNIKTSWDKFYPNYNISRTMFFNYLSGRYDIPKELHERWLKISDIKLKQTSEIIKQKFVRKTLPMIKIDEKLSEILGILNGDGHISNFKHEVCVVGDIREKDYLIYIKSLFEDKLGLTFTVFLEPTRFKLRTYSSELSNFFINKCCLPKGNKIGRLKIPYIAQTSHRLMISYLRGVFDTDGTIYQRRRKNFVLEIASADKNFLSELKNALSTLGFNFGVSGKHIYLYKEDEIRRFFKTIKPANSKHLKKFDLYTR